MREPVNLRQLLQDFFRTKAPLAPGQGLVVAFSGGPDSCALLAGMQELAAHRKLDLRGAHLDHGLDAGSRERAEKAARIASGLGVPLILESVELLQQLRPGEGVEEAARRVRYAFLEKTRQSVGARYIATAHHKDDQAETVLLRLAFGTGLAGLAGIFPVHGAIVRPLLSTTRRQLAEEARSRGLCPVVDPTNADLGHQRNRIRHRTLPLLAAGEENLPHRLSTIADAAQRARTNLDRRLASLLDLRQEARGEASLCLRRLKALPRELLPFALAVLQRHSQATYPVPRAARRELRRQLLSGHRLQLDSGGGWRLEGHQDRLWLYRTEPPILFFSYTFRVPGRLEMPEIGARLQLSLGREGTFCRQDGIEALVLTHQASLQLPLGSGDLVTVRNRRPGDRVTIPGSRSGRRLKEIFIDLKVPRRQRDRLPLLCIGNAIVWIPGIAAGMSNDDGRQLTAWNAEITDL